MVKRSVIVDLTSRPRENKIVGCSRFAGKMTTSYGDNVYKNDLSKVAIGGLPGMDRAHPVQITDISDRESLNMGRRKERALDIGALEETDID